MQKNHAGYDISRKAVQALQVWKRSTESKKRMILNSLEIPVIISDINGEFLDINKQGQDILGYNRDYLLQSGFYSISFPDDIESNLNAVLNDHNILRFRDKCGKARYFFVNTYHYEGYFMHIFLEAYGCQRPVEALTISEQKYKSLVENAIDGIFVMNNDKFLYVNKPFCDIFGYDKDEMLKLNPADLVLSEERTEFTRVINRIFLSERLIRARHDLKCIRKNGEKIICEIGYNSTLHNGQYAIQGHTKDISERKRIEEELKASEEKYRLVVENAFDAICVCDEQRLFYVNRQMCNLTEYSLEELLKMKNWEWISPEHRQRFKLIVKKCLRDTEESSNYHIESISKENQRKVFDCVLSSTMFASKQAVLVILRDISAARCHEFEKRMKRRKVNLVIRILRVLAESKNAEEAYYNMLMDFGDFFPAYAFELCVCEGDDRLKIFGLRDNQPYSYKVDSLHGNQLFSAIKHKTNIYRTLIPGINHPEDEYFYKAGYKFVASIPVRGLYNDFALFRFASSVPEENSECRMITEIITEIAIAMETFIYREKMKQIDRKVAEEEKNILLSKFELIGEMSASIAHQVRNPMTTVKGLAQLLLNECSEQKDYYQLMIEEIDMANDILGEFLSLSANSFFCKEKINLTDLLHGVVDFMHQKIMIQGTYIQVNINQSFIGVYGDCDQLKQAFLNILNNALDVSGPEDMITISADTMGDLVLISFIDHGPGIDDSDIKHIIEPFYTTKVNNTGLGLSVSYKIIKDHGGELVINSELNKGTTIEISLPLYKE